MKQCIRPQRLGNLQGQLQPSLVVTDQMFRPDTKFHVTIPRIRLADDGSLNITFPPSMLASKMFMAGYR